MKIEWCEEKFRSSYSPSFLGCWTWTATTRAGYGLMQKFVDGERVVIRAHRYSYERSIGPIPDGLDIDHLCRNRACVNPFHLEPVTRGENTRRQLAAISPLYGRRKTDFKTHCVNGHPLSGENVYIRPGFPNQRRCRSCARAKDARLRARRRLHVRCPDAD